MGASANAVRVIRTVFGVDQLGAQTAVATDVVYGMNLAGQGIPAGVRSGMKGSPRNSFGGDLGPLQAFGPIGHARGAIRSGMGKGLPSTNGAPMAPTTTQALLGPGPL